MRNQRFLHATKRRLTHCRPQCERSEPKDRCAHVDALGLFVKDSFQCTRRTYCLELLLHPLGLTEPALNQRWAVPDLRSPTIASLVALYNVYLCLGPIVSASIFVQPLMFHAVVSWQLRFPCQLVYSSRTTGKWQWTSNHMVLVLAVAAATPSFLYSVVCRQFWGMTFSLWVHMCSSRFRSRSTTILGQLSRRP